MAFFGNAINDILCGLKNQKVTELKISHESLGNLCYGGLQSFKFQFKGIEFVMDEKCGIVIVKKRI